eukprot:10651036-Lingulodinium_polyedra.AAC.1
MPRAQRRSRQRGLARGSSVAPAAGRPLPDSLRRRAFHLAGARGPRMARLRGQAVGAGPRLRPQPRA